MKLSFKQFMVIAEGSAEQIEKLVNELVGAEMRYRARKDAPSLKALQALQNRIKAALPIFTK